VGDAYELDRERADLDDVARLHRLQPVGDIETVLFELRLEQREREGGAIDRTVEQRHHVRDAADVVLVAVGEDERLDMVATGLDVGHVGDDQVDPELIGVRKHHAGVDQDGRVLPRHGHHVHAELAKAAQGDDLESGRRHRGYRGLIHSGPSKRECVWPAASRTVDRLSTALRTRAGWRRGHPQAPGRA
jgi:hypothetical protein